MPQVSMNTTTRVVEQVGNFLGGRDGCVNETVSDETLAAIQAASPDHGCGVILNADHTSVSPAEETAEAAAFRGAQEQAAADRQADLALLAASGDPHHQAMARLLAGG